LVEIAKFETAAAAARTARSGLVLGQGGQGRGADEAGYLGKLVGGKDDVWDGGKRGGALEGRLAAVLVDGLGLCPNAVVLLPLEGLVDLFGHDLEEGLVDLALAVAGKPAVGAGNAMNEEEDVKKDGDEEEQDGKDPDEEGKDHAAEDDGLAIVGLGEGLELVEKGGQGTANVGFGGEQVGLVDGLESEGVDDLAGAGADENADPS